MQSNFAALNIPEENQARNYNNEVILSSHRKIYLNIPNPNSRTFRDNFNLEFSHLIQNPYSQEIRGVFQIVLPILQRNSSLRNRSFIMNPAKSFEDNHEPMEIEDISFTERNEKPKPFIKKEKQTEDEVPKPKKILRESKLTKVLEGQKLPEVIDITGEDMSDKREETDSESSEAQNPKMSISDVSRMLKTKSKLRSLVKKDANPIEEGKKSSFFDFWHMLFFILFPIAVLVACVSIAREEFDAKACLHRFDATEAIGDLENRVFGQTKAIHELNSHLAINSSGLNLLAIIGGTGVGKSYAAHIISENFVSKKNVFQYVPPLKPRRRFAEGAISFCGCNLIILENLNNKDIAEAANFVEYLAGKIDNVNYCVLIIQVINVQETDDNLKHEVNLAKSTSDIDNIYRNKNLDIKIVQFQHLDDETLTKCILDAARNGNLTLSENEIDDVRISLKISDSGCKGARAKVQLLDKKLDLI